ncbi:MAG TPA: RNA polymerase sigma factor, partial [Candidatus Dormibacteraeota bacterium]|nr:RNA polymerase sigma factor [Candidatus Dormibacteraeota bacterium]
MSQELELDDFGAFYEATYRHAFRTALAILGEPAIADDAVQDAYVAAFRSRDRFRGDAPAEAWLTRIVVNTAISAARKRRVRWTDPIPFDATSRPGSDPVARTSILSALGSLPPEQRAAVVLRYDRDLDYESIARILGTSSGTVGSWLSRALRRLERQLRDE